MTGALGIKSPLTVVPRVDVAVNGRERAAVIESSERTVIDQVVDRLAQKYWHVPTEKVADVVNTCYARFEGRPIRDVVPLFVERGARDQLAQMIG